MASSWLPRRVLRPCAESLVDAARPACALASGADAFRRLCESRMPAVASPWQAMEDRLTLGTPEGTCVDAAETSSGSPCATSNTNAAEATTTEKENALRSKAQQSSSNFSAASSVDNPKRPIFDFTGSDQRAPAQDQGFRAIPEPPGLRSWRLDLPYSNLGPHPLHTASAVARGLTTPHQGQCPGSPHHSLKAGPWPLPRRHQHTGPAAAGPGDPRPGGPGDPGLVGPGPGLGVPGPGDLDPVVPGLGQAGPGGPSPGSFGPGGPGPGSFIPGGSGPRGPGRGVAGPGGPGPREGRPGPLPPSKRPGPAPGGAAPEGKGKGASAGPRLNRLITVPYVRLVTEGGHEVLSRAEALSRAYEAGLDLMEVDARADPPVCRLVDHKRFVFESRKKEKDLRKKQLEKRRMDDIKDVRISARTERRDLEMKADMARRHLQRGHRVKCMLIYTQSEKRQDPADAKIKELLQLVEDVGKMETQIRDEGHKIWCILKPLN